MSIRIVVLGEISEQDLQVLTTVSGTFENGADVRITVSSDIPADKENLPQGYLSFHPCTLDTVQNIFGSLPIGTGERIPFYQRVDDGKKPAFLDNLPISGVFETPLTELAARNLCESMVQHERFMQQNRDLIGEVIKYRKQKHQLIKIGTALSMENDLDKLLELILLETRDVVCADAGSVYVREREGRAKNFNNTLRFKIAQNYSVDVGTKSKEFPVPIDTNTIAGYVAHTGETLNIEDVYILDETVPYKFGKGFDKAFGYRMKSMLTIPLKNMGGVVVGVVQLMNKKSDARIKLNSEKVVHDNVVPFSYSDEDFVHSIASLAAVSIERAQLYEDIKQLFEGFLDSSIAAVDERDRVTSGHSRRVMGYAMAFANAVNAVNDGPFAAEHFSDRRLRQFKFAALLHDIGKIGVPERLLTKETRLSEGEFSAVLSRLEFVRFCLAHDVMAKKLPWDSEEEMESDREFLQKVNVSGFLSDKDHERLATIKEKQYEDSYGTMQRILTNREWESLSVRKGNLTDEERVNINSHARATWRILSKIPWTLDLEKIPEIAAHHHEKLDGSGYPDNLLADEIVFESKVLAVVDIYEALVAQDRPYKPAMPPERALSILDAEVKSGHLDPDIVDFFKQRGIYKIFLDSMPAASK